MYGKSNTHLVASKRVASTQQGVVLLESLIAIVIFSMGILALIGLQAAMVSNTAASKFRADASYIAQQKLGQLWADPANVAASTTDVPALPNGVCEITIPAAGQVLIVVTWQQPGETEVHNVTTNARIVQGV
jgi:type IV pilus assembly protein PilV